MAGYKKVAEQGLIDDDHEENDVNDYDDRKLAKASTAPAEKGGLLSKLHGFTLIVTGCVAFAIVITIALVIDIILKDPITGHGAVSSDIGECSVMAAKLMKTGGNGMDAAVATAFCISVFSLGSTGIGSGGYMLIHGPNGADKAIDFQFMASANATENMFAANPSAAERGGLSVAVPGFVQGLQVAHERFGKLQWADLIEPSIRYAREGFKLPRRTAALIKDNFNAMSQELKDVVAPRGVLPSSNTIVRYPKMADILQDIASHASDSVYKEGGRIRKEILETVKANGGILTEDDFLSYKPTVKDVLRSKYNGYRVLTSHPPSSGIVVLAALNAIDRFHLTSSTSAESFQVIIEALKFAFAGRSHIGDPSFRPEMENVTELFLSDEFVGEIKKKITLDATHDPSYYSSVFTPADTPGTSHISVMGPNEELISLTTTLGLPFGSGLATASGIVLNGGMSEFSLPSTAGSPPPNKANLIEPLKRPLSAAAPLIIFNRKTPCQDMMVLGAAGGKKLISSLVQVVVDLLSFDMSLSAAVQRPRIHHQLYPNEVFAEGMLFQRDASLSRIISALKAIGHMVNESSTHLGNVNGITLKKQNIEAYSDSRVDGLSAQF